ncbi:MAG: helix-turn-helix domain-containing GNAT family N-acetyltransferase [Candidatus Sphingomonas colombiensis]|nr:helix-turn-helix domain-containing GNAT family N-acetyltransferase [Sphingomonas sp.]WEK44623.1 MAG: helix-turn-helix domain-containing GNAT family N-acetyltransferase [Sphingomonas sp.]
MDGTAQLVGQIRNVSRAIVREWGFMGGNFAGTELSPSAVHALMEIERGGATARDIGIRLRLEKSSVSRMLRKLVEAGDVKEEAGGSDGRVKLLSLSASGKDRVVAIHAFADTQVVDALRRLQPAQSRAVLEGLRLYADALGGKSGGPSCPDITIASGYYTGLIARVTEMHALYYARESGFGRHFESVVARGLADLCARLESPRNAIWSAMREDEMVGSISIDGEDLGADIAHLRFFITADDARGSGAGRKLLSAAMAFVDERNFAETQLWTFRGLAAARHLYESFGFVCVEEWSGRQWGPEMIEQRFVRPRQPL